MVFGTLVNTLVLSSGGDAPDNTSGKRLEDEADLFGLKVPITLHDVGTSITPWGLYATIGKDSGFWNARVAPVNASRYNHVENNGKAWWGGLAARTAYFDPLVIKYDFAYGDMRTGRDERDFNAKGWQSSLAMDYKLDSCTPGVFGWYASGSKADDVKNDRQWGFTPIIDTFGESFNPTSFGYGRNDVLTAGNAISGFMGGSWGIGAQISDISFIDKLSHEIRVAYYRGTNDNELAENERANRTGLFGAGILTKDDDVYEVNFNHKYQIYENLIFTTELGYINFSTNNKWRSSDHSENAWQAMYNFKYRF